jgi:hypothetical protein
MGSLGGDWMAVTASESNMEVVSRGLWEGEGFHIRTQAVRHEVIEFD